MKTYYEISHRVLERRDEYLTIQKAKRKKLLQISTAVGCFALAVGIGLGVSRDWVRTQIVIPTNLGGNAIHTAPITTNKINSTNNLTEDVPTTVPNIDTTESSTTVPPENWTTSPTTEQAEVLTTGPISSVPTTVPPELYHEIDWNYKSMPGKFFAVVLDCAKYGDVVIKPNKFSDFNEYVYPFKPREEQPTTRKATEFISDMKIEAIDHDLNVHTTNIDVFTLEGLSADLAIGVRFPDDDRIYTYVNNCYIPETLGEFLEAIDYDNTITYGGITLYPGNNFPVNNKNAKDIKSYLLSDTDVKNIRDMSVTGTSVTASISCRELGRENKFLKICEGGYISTNLIGYEYVFCIGKDAAANFLKNSYNITLEQIKEIYYATMKTTEPYTANTTTSSANFPGTVVGTTGNHTTSAPNDPMWWCGTAM